MGYAPFLSMAVRESFLIPDSGGKPGCCIRTQTLLSWHHIHEEQGGRDPGVAAIPSCWRCRYRLRLIVLPSLFLPWFALLPFSPFFFPLLSLPHSLLLPFHLPLICLPSSPPPTHPLSPFPSLYCSPFPPQRLLYHFIFPCRLIIHSSFLRFPLQELLHFETLGLDQDDTPFSSGQKGAGRSHVRDPCCKRPCNVMWLSRSKLVCFWSTITTT